MLQTNAKDILCFFLSSLIHCSCSRLHQYPSPYDDTIESFNIADDQDVGGLDEPIDNSCLVLQIPKMFTHYHLDLTKNTGSEDQGL